MIDARQRSVGVKQIDSTTERFGEGFLILSVCEVLDLQQYVFQFVSESGETARSWPTMWEVYPNAAVPDIPAFSLGIALILNAPSSFPKVGHRISHRFDQPPPTAANEPDRHAIAHPRIVYRNVMHAETERALVLELCYPLQRVFGKRSFDGCGAQATEADECHILAECENRRRRPEILSRLSVEKIIADDREGYRLSDLRLQGSLLSPNRTFSIGTGYEPRPTLWTNSWMFETRPPNGSSSSKRVTPEPAALST